MYLNQTQGFTLGYGLKVSPSGLHGKRPTHAEMRAGLHGKRPTHAEMRAGLHGKRRESYRSKLHILPYFSPHVPV